MANIQAGDPRERRVLRVALASTVVLQVVGPPALEVQVQDDKGMLGPARLQLLKPELQLDGACLAERGPAHIFVLERESTSGGGTASCHVREK